MDGWLPTILGTIAGLLSTFSFVPQVIKAWREGHTEAISKSMYVVTVSAFSLWTIYGFVIGSMPIIIFNILSLLLSATILILKLRSLSASNAARGGRTEPETARSG
jgi:MtN3 and saliva related transmembrane protein